MKVTISYYTDPTKNISNILTNIDEYILKQFI